VEDIAELARKLGAAISQSPQAANLRAARKALDARPEVKKLMEDLRRQSEKIGELERQNKPVEVEDKHRLQDVHDKLIADDLFKKYTAAQVEYVDLMRKVSSTMTAALSQVEGESPAAR
jgi:cell fate (sporulation/competence/biofilm development) regulator YlbF (YheA/YmcA/DUF963 family)